MEKNKIKVSILGTEYMILTADPEQELQKMAAEVESQIKTLLKDNPRLSTSMASVLAALDFYDGKIKAEQTVDSLQKEIEKNREEAERSREAEKESSARARKEAEEARLEMERVHSETIELRNRLVNETKEIIAKWQREADESKAEAQRMHDKLKLLKGRLTGETKNVTREMEDLLEENATLKTEQTRLYSEIETAQRANIDARQALDELQKRYESMQQNVGEEITAIQGKAINEMEEARKITEPLREKAELLQKQVADLTKKNEEGEREAAKLRIQLAELEMKPSGTKPEGTWQTPAREQSFSGGREEDPIRDTDSTAEDLLSFFNRLQDS